MLRRLLIASLCVFFTGNHMIMAQSLEEVKDLYNNESYSDAVQMANNLIKTDDKNPEFYYWKGKALFAAGNVQGAEEAFTEGTKAKGRYPQNYIGLARVLISEGKSAEAEELIEDKALYYDKGRDINVKYEAAEAYLEDEKFKKAEVFLMQTQTDEPDNPRSYVALGDYYWKKGVNELALDQYQKAINLDDAFVEGYARVGQIKVEEQEYDAGATALTKAIDLEPDYAPPYKIMGELWLKAGDYTQARDYLKKYVELAGNDLAARIQYASYMFLNDQYQEVVDELSIIEQDTVTNLMRRLLGMAYANLGQAEKGKGYMDDYFEQYPEEFHTATDFEAYGKILLAKGDKEAANEYFEKAIAKNPDRTEVYNELAEDFAAKAKKIKDENPEAHKEALQDAAYYAEIYLNNTEPKSLKLYYETAKAMYAAERYEDAQKYFEEVLKLKEDYVVPYRYLLSIANKKDLAAKAANPDTITWNTIKPSKRIVEVFGKKDPSELSKTEKGSLVSALEVLAFYNFNPTGEDGNYHCENALPFIDQIKENDPNYQGDYTQIAEYCQAVQEAAQQGGNK